MISARPLLYNQAAGACGGKGGPCWRTAEGRLGGEKGSLCVKEARGESDEPRFPAGRRPGRWTETPSRARRPWEGEGISPHGQPAGDGLPVFRPGVARRADVVAFTPVPGNGGRKEAAYPGDFPPLCSPLAREGNLLWTGPDGRSGKEAPTRNALSRKAFRGRPRALPGSGVAVRRKAAGAGWTGLRPAACQELC